MKRLTDWPTLLAQQLIKNQTTPYAWGTNDCVTFSADCVQAMTGIDPIPEYRGRWSTEKGAMRLIKRAGFDDLGDMAGSMFPNISPIMAKRGDLVFCAAESGNFLAVMNGACAIGPSSKGVLHIPRSQFLRAFKVGE